MGNKVLISFDVEEFDLPREHGVEISLNEGIKVSAQGLERILKVLKNTNIRATFFCTGNFAEGRPDLIKEILKDGHEVACHGVDHFEPQPSDVKKSKEILEKVIGGKIYGYRQPRMQKIDYEELKRRGYRYDSSVNPAFIPGRYNNFDIPRKLYKVGGIVEIPTSVATFARVPLFWLALHIFPERLYLGLAKNALKRDGYFATYFHPWEFADIMGCEAVPKYIKHNSGEKMVERLESVIRGLKRGGNEFMTYSEYMEAWYNANKKKGKKSERKNRKI